MWVLVIVVLALAAIAAGVLAHPAFGVYRHVSKEKIERSPNYYDGMFQNQEPTPQFTGKGSRKTAAEPLKVESRKTASLKEGRVPKKPIEAVKTDLKALPTDEDWLVWFGHSSYLFCLNGKRFLVDPVLKPEFPSSLMLKAFPGTDIYRPEDLPTIDVLIITHEHWDHMDYATLRDLRTKVQTVVCPLGIADYLRYWGYSDEQIIEMDWYDSSGFRLSAFDLFITCLPSRHFSNRLLGKRNQTLWASFLIEAGGRKVYIGGDGGYDKRFREIRERFGKIDLAFLENGQYNENWRYIHTTPEGLEQAMSDLQAEQYFTVHHDKFALAMHPWQEPEQNARTIATKHHLCLLDAKIGEKVDF
ncbi:MAG: MBL fold metallo-hydrolase [Paludibacteraceae bacterium]|nr:MBL fold metallo-hydrolase [Paludibacteraceae bacterium]